MYRTCTTLLKRLYFSLRNQEEMLLPYYTVISDGVGICTCTTLVIGRSIVDINAYFTLASVIRRNCFCPTIYSDQ